ncbi:MAG: pyridoxamine 5'-phosphate oxidase family protein [Firmicutes bacterium]|nr:pyridoxamine 5'-phosphate oxidase family protein [Bacillota bacterium]
MIREMNRRKQALLEAESIAVLERNTAGVLALMGDEGYPYGVPLSYAYADGKIYFHCAKRGYKLDCMKANPKVCFTVIDADQIVPEEYTTYFRSVIAMGQVRILEEGDERIAGLWALTEKYSGSMPEAAKRGEVEGCRGALVGVIDIEYLTGKEARELVEQRMK